MRGNLVHYLQCLFQTTSYSTLFFCKLAELRFLEKIFDLGVKYKVDGLGLNWTVQKTKNGRSAKMDGPEIQKWMFQRKKTVRSG